MINFYAKIHVCMVVITKGKFGQLKHLLEMVQLLKAEIGCKIY